MSSIPLSHQFNVITSVVPDIDALRGIIDGRRKFRKCLYCDKEGIDLQSYGPDGNPIPVGGDTSDSMRYACEHCHGLGFIECGSSFQG